ncbi:unnamed protein product, partial [Amoebophrya sp. A120]
PLLRYFGFLISNFSASRFLSSSSFNVLLRLTEVSSYPCSRKLRFEKNGSKPRGGFSLHTLAVAWNGRRP